MGPDLHPRLAITLRARDTCRRRTHRRTYIRAVTTRQLCRGPHDDQSFALLNELHEQQNVSRIHLQEDGSSFRCVCHPFAIHRLLTVPRLDSDTAFLWAGSAVCCFKEHLAYNPETTNRPQE
jgi:hypothetical protein